MNQFSVLLTPQSKQEKYVVNLIQPFLPEHSYIKNSPYSIEMIKNHRPTNTTQ